MITKIILEASGVNTVNDINAVKVDLEDDGRVIIYHTDKEIINNAIEKALKMADEKGISGKDITPFLLKTIVELTNGDSLESNIKLVLNNAKLGAEIALELSKL